MNDTLQHNGDAKPKRSATYNRVSTKAQAEHGLSLDAQQERTAAKAREFGELVREYVERGVSGRRDSRPELDRMLADAEARAFDVLVIPKLDRLGRSVRQLQENFARLEDAGVQLVSLAESIDTSTAAGKLLRNVLAALAEFETDVIGERVRSVNQRRIKGGKHNGGPRPYGYRYRRGALGIVTEEAVIVVRIFEEYVCGKRQINIAHDLNADGISSLHGGDWHQGTVGALLANPLYKGFVKLHGEEFPGEHEAIVPTALWERAARLREASAQSRGRGRGRYPKGRHLFVKGQLRCALCGEAMSPITKPTRTGGTYEVYQCYGRNKKKNGCPMPTIRREVIDSGVIDYFLHVAVDADATRTQLEQARDRSIEEVRALLDRAERDEQQASERRSRVKRDYQDGKLEAEDWREQRDELTAELDAARAKRERLRQRAKEVRDDFQLRDAEEETLRQFAHLREAIVGDMRDAVAATVDGTRAALNRLFESFTLHCFEEGMEAVARHPRYWQPELLLPGHGGLYVEPHVRPQAIKSAAPQGFDGEVIFPVLHREPLSVAEDNCAVGLAT